MALLSAKRMKDVICLDRVDSTNRYLGNLALDGAPDGQIVLSENRLTAVADGDALFSLREAKDYIFPCFYVPFVHRLTSPLITAWTAVAVMRAIEEVCGMKPGIKWVNDLFLNGKKNQWDSD